MAIVNDILKGQLIWTKHLCDIQDKKGCVFLRHPVGSISVKHLARQTLHKQTLDTANPGQNKHNII